MTTPEHEPRPDPLIDEIREIRRDLSRRFGDDLDKLIEHLREIERQHPERVVTPGQLRKRRDAKRSP